MNKKQAKRCKDLDPFSIRLDVSGVAELLGLSVARVNQLRREGGLKAGADGLYGAVDALRAHYFYDSPRGEALRARTRQTNARALEVEQRTRREMRQLLRLSEVGQFASVLHDNAIGGVQAESSRFFGEYRKTHGEAESLEMAHQLYGRLTRHVQAWLAGMQELLDHLEREHMPNVQRLETVLEQLRGDIAASYAADEQRTATSASTPKLETADVE